LLGQGGFGRVYLARDEQLQRLVAIKVPHRHLIASSADADAYLAEARTGAGLDHPGIVPAFDVGSMTDLACFTVFFLGARVFPVDTSGLPAVIIFCGVDYAGKPQRPE
jgi:serine/threonine protein kinase